MNIRSAFVGFAAISILGCGPRGNQEQLTEAPKEQPGVVRPNADDPQRGRDKASNKPNENKPEKVQQPTKGAEANARPRLEYSDKEEDGLAPVATKDGTWYPQDYRRLAPGGEEIVVNARTLWKRFQANEVRANTKYQGKSVCVCGRIGAVKVDKNGDPYITLSTGESKQEALVACQFDKAENNEIALINEEKISHVVSIRGVCKGLTYGAPTDYITLADCKLIQVSPKPK